MSYKKTPIYKEFLRIKTKIREEDSELTDREHEIYDLYAHDVWCDNCGHSCKKAFINYCTSCDSKYCVLRKYCYDSLFSYGPDQFKLDDKNDIINCPRCKPINDSKKAMYNSTIKKKIERMLTRYDLLEFLNKPFD